MSPVFVGIGGGSGSGKTTLASALAQALGAGNAVVIPHDAYYRDLAHLSLAERARVNFDQPEALDNQRLIADLASLRVGQSVLLPQYDFAHHTRQAETVTLEPRPVVIVEGILVLAIEALRGVFDLRVFVDAARETCMSRRIQRDTAERGRSHDAVVAQYNTTTLPMHQRFIAPSRGHAHVIVSGEGDLAQATAAVVARLRPLLDA